MLSRYVLSALLLAAFLPSAALAAPIGPVNLADPTFRQVIWYTDGIDGPPGAASIGAPFVPPNIGNDISDLSVHGLTHPCANPANTGGATTRGAVGCAGVVYPVLPVGGAGNDYLDELPIGGLGNLPSTGMIQVPAPAYAFGGSSPGPDILDGLLFNFLIPGAVIEAVLNSDNVIGPPGAGPDGVVAIAGTFTNALYTLDLTAPLDATGGVPVVSGTLTGLTYVPGLVGGLPPTIDPNTGAGIYDPNNIPLPFEFYDTAAVDPNGALLGTNTIGLNTVGGGTGTWLGGGYGLTSGTTEIMFGCEPGNPTAVGNCLVMPSHGYVSAAATPLTAAAASLALPGAWGVSVGATGGGGINIGVSGLRVVPIGVINATGALNFASGGFVVMATQGDIGFSEIPEPSTILLMGAGVAGLLALRRRSSRQA